MRRILSIAALSFTLSVVTLADPSPAPELTTKQLLNSRVNVIDFNQIALADALEYLRDTTGMNIFVNWAALESIGVDQSTQITVKLRQVGVRKLLDLMLNSAAPGQLSWFVDDNVIHITSADLSNQAMVTRMYPVEDLMLEIPNFKGPQMDLDTNGQGGGTPFDGSGNDNDEGRSEDERAQELIRLIQMMVVPDTWQENGGLSSIEYFGGSLIVIAPRKVHELLGGPID